MSITLSIFLILVVLYKFLLNLHRYLRVKYFLRWYHKWLKTKEWDLVQYQPEVLELFNKAHIGDAAVPVIEPVGYGQILTTTSSAFLNFPSQDFQTANLLTGFFHKAIGVYRRRMWQSLNPFWWIEFVLFMPANIINFLGLSSENITSKVFQIVYWILGVAVTVMLSLYPEIIKERFQDLFVFLFR